MPVWPAEVGHEDDGLGTAVEDVLDGGDGGDDALSVGDVAFFVLWDVEVDAHEDTLVREGDVGDCFLGELHG